jgi:hypothetical protein
MRCRCAVTLLLMLAAAGAAPVTAPDPQCHIVVLGGSASALATALSAAAVNASLVVCLTEPTYVVLTSHRLHVGELRRRAAGAVPQHTWFPHCPH